MTKPDSITIVANGKNFTCQRNTSLEIFLTSLHLRMDHVVIEYNKRALTKKEALTIMLQNGDQLEIVRIIAGG